MKTKLFGLLFLGLALCYANSVSAKVTFLPATSVGVGSNGNGRNLTSEERCRQIGYTRTSCNQDRFLADPCPHNGNLFKNCCSKDYRFSKEECEQNGLRAGSSCGGFYKCS